MVVALASCIPVIALDAVLLLPVYTTCMDTTIMQMCTDLAVLVLIVGDLASGDDPVSACSAKGAG